jgi:hypothetical protein
MQESATLPTAVILSEPRTPVKGRVEGFPETLGQFLLRKGISTTAADLRENSSWSGIGRWTE